MAGWVAKPRRAPVGVKSLHFTFGAAEDVRSRDGRDLMDANAVGVKSLHFTIAGSFP